jgi:hypothetical protein
LGDSAIEDIEHARILTFSCTVAQLSIKVIRVATRELLHTFDAQQVEIVQHRRADTAQIGKSAHTDTIK